MGLVEALHDEFFDGFLLLVNILPLGTCLCEMLGGSTGRLAYLEWGDIMIDGVLQAIADSLRGYLFEVASP